VIKAMDWIARLIAKRNVGVDAERLVRKVVRKTPIDGHSFVELLYGA